jgi:hypothetical protein
MTGIDSYSITPATNATFDGGSGNWAEGQAPSTVNNTGRQMLADMRAAFNDLAWFQYGSGDQGAGNIAVPCVYASGTSFTIAGVNVTSAFHVGRPVRAVGALTGTIYGAISTTAFATNTTVTVVWDSGSLSNETLVISLSQVPVTGAPVSAAGVRGTVTNDSAAAGRIGEYLTANASGVSLSNGTNANITSVSLTAGDWEVSGTVLFNPTGATITSLQAGISSTSATFTAISGGGKAQLAASGIDGSAANSLPTPTYRFSLSATTTIYLVASQNFSAGSITGSGYIGARRMR